MRLAICDDNELERGFLQGLLKKYFSEAAIGCEFTLYDRGTTLYYDITDGMEFDIIFLDLFMEDSFGLTVAKKLRELSYGGRIIFCTASADYALESYSVYASGYIVKPYRIKDIRHTLDRLLPEYQRGSYGLVQKSAVKFIPLNEIMYVESSNTKCILHRVDGRTYNVYKKLGEIEAELDDARFLRCHQSYLVNMNYVSEADDSFLLQNGDKVLIRAKSKKMILQKLLEYKEKMCKTGGFLSKRSMV